MSKYFLRSRKRLRLDSEKTASLAEVQRSANTAGDCTRPALKGKRKKNGGEKCQKKRRKRGEREPVSSKVPSEGQREEVGRDQPQIDQEDNEAHNESTVRDTLNDTYVQLHCLGAGGFGSVYAGYRKEDHIPVAIKYIPINTVICTPVLLDGRPMVVPLEVLLLLIAGVDRDNEARCQPIEILDFFELPDQLVIVMDRPIPSKDLYDHIDDRGGQLEEDEAKEIFKQLVKGMIRIHNNGVLHRDLKLDNILIQTDSEGPHLRILDFGCGSLLREGPYTEYSGTPNYTPPEWFQENLYHADPCTVWQLGVVLFLLLTGCFPFGDSRETCGADPEIPATLSQECQDLLGRCLNKKPEDRPALHSLLDHQWLKQV